MVLSREALENILIGCQNGKEHLKESLYKNFYGYIKGVVVRYINDYHTTEELVNDSFIKIFNNISSFRALGESTDILASFKAWIAKIASRTAIDSLRKRKLILMNEETHEYVAGPVYDQTLSSEVRDILKLLNELPQTQKAIFNLYEIEGFSHQEIAGILSISENVSRSYLSRAKNKLKTLYLEKF